MSIVSVHGPTMLGVNLNSEYGITGFADLDALKADGTFGDGTAWLPGNSWPDNAYVKLDDGTKATWDGSVWTEWRA